MFVVSAEYSDSAESHFGLVGRGSVSAEPHFGRFGAPLLKLYLTNLTSLILLLTTKKIPTVILKMNVLK